MKDEPQISASLTARLRELQQYLRHDPSCKSYVHMKYSCTCRLTERFDALLASAEKGQP